MPTVFDSHFAAAGFPMLLSNFGESITYFPRSGGYRVIQAIVTRDPPAIFNAAGDAIMPRAMIRVHNSAATGISSKEVDIGSDEIELPEKVGNVILKRFSLLTMTAQDSGVTELALV